MEQSHPSREELSPPSLDQLDQRFEIPAEPEEARLTPPDGGEIVVHAVESYWRVGPMPEGDEDRLAGHFAEVISRNGTGSIKTIVTERRDGGKRDSGNRSAEPPSRRTP